jgi:hypothetical protein
VGCVERACESVDLRVYHIGYRDREMRIVFAQIASDSPQYTVELHGLHSFVNGGIFKIQPVLLEVSSSIGSFGWYLWAEQRARHSEVFLRCKDEPSVNPFRAIVQHIVQRECDLAADANWPG